MTEAAKTRVAVMTTGGSFIIALVLLLKSFVYDAAALGAYRADFDTVKQSINVLVQQSKEKDSLDAHQNKQLAVLETRQVNMEITASKAFEVTNANINDLRCDLKEIQKDIKTLIAQKHNQ